MTAVKPIVVGTDGSAESTRAVEWAAKEATLRKAPLRIVSTAELLPRMAGPAGFGDTGKVASIIKEGAVRALDAAAGRAAALAPEVYIDTDLLTGPAAISVCDCGSGAQLLVVGSRGAGPFTAMVLGSVSRYTAIHAACPVVVVREETMAVHRQIIVGIRHVNDCDAALAFAFEEAGLHKASLLAVHASQAPYTSYPYPPVPFSPVAAVNPAELARAEEAQSVAALEELLSGWRAKYPDVVANQDVVHGHPGRVLAGLSARADLVVLGRHGTNGVARVAHAVLSHAHGPVATVPSA